MSRKIVCFGEVLWDQFEKLSLPGGAPMNVALNLKQLGGKPDDLKGRR